jgi:hypothetical protein
VNHFCRRIADSCNSVLNFGTRDGRKGNTRLSWLWLSNAKSNHVSSRSCHWRVRLKSPFGRKIGATTSSMAYRSKWKPELTPFLTIHSSRSRRYRQLPQFLYSGSLDNRPVHRTAQPKTVIVFKNLFFHYYPSN